MRRVALLVSAGIAVFMLAACEKSQVAGPDKQGRYQGKNDTAPWDNEQFKGDRNAWEKALKERALSQNEYRRTN
jgi:uncharacterized protein YgiB involved in biofilm formation